MRSDVSSGLALALSVGWLACSGAAWGQTPTEAVHVESSAECDPKVSRCEAPEPAEIVITGTRTKESAQRATVRTGVVTRKEANRRGARSVAEALSSEPGLQRQPAMSGVSGGIKINGMDCERVLVLEDGEPITGRSAGALDLGEVPISGVGRIEVVAGPMSSLYGSDAIGGVVNIITAPPEHEGLSLLTRSEARTRGQFFEEGSAHYRRDTSWVSLEGSLVGQNAIEVGGGPDLSMPSTRTRMFGLRMGAELLPEVEVTLKVRWTKDHRESIFSQSEVIGGEPVRLLDAPTLDSDRFALRATETVQLGARSRVDFSMSRSWYSGETRTRRAGRIGDEIQEDTEHVQHLEAAVTAGEGSRTWVFGVTNRSEKLNTTARVWDLARYVERQPSPPTRRTNVAALAQVTWDIVDELTLMPGTRVEVHNQHGLVASPKLSLAYRPTPELTARAGVGRGFRSPAPKELGFLLDHCWIGYSVTGDPDLDPEKSWGVTGDVSYRPADGVTLHASGFDNRLTDMIALVLTDGGPCGGRTNYQNVNIARARTAGGGAGVKLRVLPFLGLEASYQYLWTRDESTGDPITGNPPHTVVASVTAENLPQGLSAYVRYRYISDSFVDYADTDFNVPGFQSLSARAGFRPAPPLELYAGADNLFDVTADRELFGDLRPTLGRTFYVGLSGEFAADGSAED
jgi:outer membrane receptor for ferrienterochelin and colicins